MNGDFCWYDLITSDVAGGVDFYSKVVGWQVETWGDGSMPLLKAGERAVGAVNPAPAGVQPYWLAYVQVADLDATLAKAVELGGAVVEPRNPVPGMGAFAVLRDPEGVPVALFEASGPMPTGRQERPGEFAWGELTTSDIARTLDFYSQVFGWTAGEAMDMGPVGTYQMFRTGGNAGPSHNGAIYLKPDDAPACGWLHYANVDSVKAAAGRVTEGGGQIQMGPMEVPGGDFIVMGIDPQGAAFAVYGPE